jgi:suppressor for copper-sensitivity B
MQQFSRILTVFIISYFSFFISFTHAEENKFNIEFKNNILYFNIELQEGYKIYGKDPGSTGIPTSINLDKSYNLKSYNVIWPNTIEEEASYIYRGQVLIPVAVSPTNDKEVMILKGQIIYSLCGNNQCVPVTQEFELNDCYMDNSHIFTMIGSGILGGFILNFMPCVLPILLLKIFSVLNLKPANYRAHLLLTIFGIFSSYWFLGLISFWFKSLGVEFGFGTHFQHPQFIIILCILMTIFVSNLLGRFSIKLPSFLASKLENQNFENQYLNSFVTGIIATIFSTPCTAPFLGTAVAFSMTAEFFAIFLIFSSIALGLSLPYFALIIWPPILKILPKPGRWMNKFKIFLAIVMIAVILWLLSILQTQLGYRAVFGIILLLLLIKFVSEQTIGLWKKLVFYIVLFAGLMYLPTTAAREDHFKEVEATQIWQKFEPYAVKDYVAQGKIVVIDVTADWCGTCKYNKFMVWSREKAVKLLRNPQIHAMREDITRASPETQRYMASLGIQGIPLNIVFGPKAPKGILLSTVLSYDELKAALIKAGLDIDVYK